MFTVIYAFTVKEGQDAAFIEAWKDMTQLIYKYEGSLGSRLHQPHGQVYLAYAQWPDRATWQNSGDRLPESSTEVRARMRASCEKIETLHELEVAVDLLADETFGVS